MLYSQPYCLTPIMHFGQDQDDEQVDMENEYYTAKGAERLRTTAAEWERIEVGGKWKAV